MVVSGSQTWRLVSLLTLKPLATMIFSSYFGIKIGRRRRESTVRILIFYAFGREKGSIILSTVNNTCSRSARACSFPWQYPLSTTIPAKASRSWIFFSHHRCDPCPIGHTTPHCWSNISASSSWGNGLPSLYKILWLIQEFHRLANGSSPLIHANTHYPGLCVERHDDWYSLGMCSTLDWLFRIH